MTTTSRGYRLGYARVSTLEQDPQLQLDALAAAGVDEVFTDHASGVLTGRPHLAELLERIRPGDTLVVWRLDRLGRSTRLAAARARGNVGGQPATMIPEKLAVARAMLIEGKSKTVIARIIGVRRPTLYTHLGRG